MSEERNFLGKGWSFPPSFDFSNRTNVMVSEESDIAQSLFIILSTRKGERILNPEFGCGIHDLVFEEIDTSLLYKIKDQVHYAILYFEPRINLLDVQVKRDKEVDGRLNILIEYNIKKVNKRSNMVYPFYFLEGTDLRFKA